MARNCTKEEEVICFCCGQEGHVYQRCTNFDRVSHLLPENQVDNPDDPNYYDQTDKYDLYKKIGLEKD